MIKMINIIDVIMSLILLIKVVVLFKWIWSGVSLLLFLLMDVIICFYFVFSFIFVMSIVFWLFCILYFERRNGCDLFFFIGKFFFVMVDLFIDNEWFFMNILFVGICFLIDNGIMLFIIRLKMEMVCWWLVCKIFNLIFFFWYLGFGSLSFVCSC